MKRMVRQLGKGGFTLIEVLVTLILLAVLVAAVFPVVTQQSEQGDPVRVANDLASIRTAVGQFRLNVRPDYPGDLEDLVFQPSSDVGTDATFKGVAYSNSSSWNGPYLDISLTENAIAPPDSNGFFTAFGGEIEGNLQCLPATGVATIANASCTSGNFVAVEIQGLSAAEAALLEEQIDGGTSANTSGKFRFDTGGSAPIPGFYVVGPFF